MKTLNIAISDVELDKLGIRKSKITFSEFLDVISKELMRQSLNKSIELASKYGLSNLTMEQISKEVKAIRKKNAKSSR